MAKESKTVILKPQGVTFEDVINVARFNAKVEISDEAKNAIDKSRKFIDEYTQGGKAYQLALAHLQINLLIQRIELNYKNP
jgi:hypothetical protein